MGLTTAFLYSRISYVDGEFDRNPLKNAMNDRYRGTLISLAVGDALGAAVEFRSPGSFIPVTGYARWFTDH